MEDSVFTKIINKALPSHALYEDDLTMAFLDIYPVQPGMVVVVPKRQVEDFYVLDDESYDALWRTVRLVAQKLHEAFASISISKARTPLRMSLFRSPS